MDNEGDCKHKTKDVRFVWVLHTDLASEGGQVVPTNQF